MARFALFVGSILIKLLSLVVAQSCPTSGPSYYAIQGTCNTDPSDPNSLELPFDLGQGWDSDLVANARVTFRDTSNAQRVYTGFPQTTFASAGDNVATFKFDVPLSDIPHSTVVTHRLYITATASQPDCIWSGVASYTQVHQPTVTSTDFITTVTQTVAQTTTTTSTIPSTDFTTTTPAEVTATSVTGYKTVYAQRVTTATTSTITPKPFTKWSLSVARTTTTVTCLGGLKGRNIERNRRNALPAALDLPKRQAPGYEEPYCGYWTTTTVFTSTNFVSATTTTTETSTEFTTSVTTSTVEAPTPTSYTSVRGTTTVTPTRTLTRWSILRPSVVTSTQIYTVTVTRFPGNKIPKKCTSTPVKNPMGPICTPILI